MPRSTRLYGAALLATLVAACKDQPSQPTALRLDPAVVRASAVDEGAPDRALLVLPGAADIADRFDAINPADYVCTSNTPVSGWINGTINNSLSLESARFLTAYNYLADVIPTYEALYFQSTATPQYFGTAGQHTKAIGKVEHQLKLFWDIPSAQIQVLAMHGDVLVDTVRTYNTYRLLGYPAANSRVYARTLRNAIIGSQTMVNGNHPFFTFNAVSFHSSSNQPSDRIVMGDGILAAYDELGFTDVAPEAIFAHEYAHQVQFANAYGMIGTPPERTRFNELGADAMAAYFLTHSRGATLNRKRVEQFLEVFYGIGDCEYTNANHHGTPNQRLAAARFGFDIADQAQKQGHIMTAAQFQALFVAQYATIVAPDSH